MRASSKWFLGVVILFLIAAFIDASAAEIVELTGTTWPSIGSKGSNAIQEIAKRYEQANPNVKINLVVGAGNNITLLEKLKLGIAGGKPFDFIMFISPVAPIASQGLLRPIDDLLSRSTKIKRSEWPEAMWRSHSWNGKTYQVPAGEVGPWTGLWYNTSLFEEAGLAGRPKTLDDLLTYHNKLTRVDSNGKLVQLGFNSYDAVPELYFLEAWEPVFEYQWWDAQTQKLKINAPLMIDAIKFTMNFNAGFVGNFDNAVQFFNQWKTWGTGAIAQGKVAMTVNGYWTPGEVASVNKGEDPYGLDYTWLPTKRGDKAIVYGGWGAGIPTGAKNVEESFRFIEYLASKESTGLIFNDIGWLNGNIRHITELLNQADSGIKNLGFKFYIDTLNGADRIYTPPSVPVLEDVRGDFRTMRNRIWREQVAPTVGMDTLQEQLTAKLAPILANIKY